MAVLKESCDVCGVKNRADMRRHHVVPPEISREAGLPCPRTVILCPDCHHKLLAWRGARVFNMKYDAGAGRFVARSPGEMVKEHEAAYRAFLLHQSRQPAQGGPR